MNFPVSDIYPEHDCYVTGASYAGLPRNHTMMYISLKVGHLIENLRNHEGCLCFIDKGIDVPKEIENKNTIIRCNNPAYEYSIFATQFQKKVIEEELKYGYSLTKGGYYVGTNVKIGENAIIEPNVLIGHNVVIGNNAIIMSGSVIKRAIIGDNFLCNENAVIGNYSFTQAVDDNGNKFRIPALGMVRIGNNVEVGACNDIAIGACGDTVLDDYVKLDSLIHIGHESHLHANTEITAGGIVSGFVEMGENSYLGVNSCIRNRIELGDNCIIGMGAVVTKKVDNSTTVVGNPARVFNK